MSAEVISPSGLRQVRARSTATWTAIGLALAAVLVAATGASFIGSIAYEPIVPTHRVLAGPVHSVQIDVTNGSITVEPNGGDSGAVVSSFGVNGISSPSDSEHVAGGVLVVHSTCATRAIENHCVRNYVVKVPTDVAVVADTESGDATIRGIKGALRIRSGQGDVSVEGATGSVQLSSAQGDVTASGLTGASASASSGQGNVRLSFEIAPSGVIATSTQGNVSVVLPRGPVAYRVHATSVQGLVTETVAVNPASHNTVRATSGQGDVTVSYKA
jgi:hypothetical protein